MVRVRTPWTEDNAANRAYIDQHVVQSNTKQSARGVSQLRELNVVRFTSLLNEEGGNGDQMGNVNWD